ARHLALVVDRVGLANGAPGERAKISHLSILPEEGVWVCGTVGRPRAAADRAAVVDTESDAGAAGVRPESAERLRRRLPALPDDGVRMRGPGDVARVIDRVGVAGGKRHSQRLQWLQVALLPLEGPVRGRLARTSKR